MEMSDSDVCNLKDARIPRRQGVLDPPWLRQLQIHVIRLIGGLNTPKDQHTSKNGVV